VPNRGKNVDLPIVFGMATVDPDNSVAVPISFGDVSNRRDCEELLEMSPGFSGLDSL